MAGCAEESAEDRIRKAKVSGATELELSSWGITDVTPLEGLTNLTKLFIYDNKVADLAPLAELKNLETLWLDGNPIPEDGKEMLEKALPNCFIDISRTP